MELQALSTRVSRSTNKITTGTVCTWATVEVAFLSISVFWYQQSVILKIVLRTVLE